jgi:hypothetical protein
MPRDKRLTNPSDYISEVSKPFLKQKTINYVEAFASKSSEGDPPFNLNRFGPRELTNKLVTRKLKYNPRLNFVGDSPEEFQLFAGLGRFDTERQELFDFELGRPRTKMNFTSSPDFKEEWVEAYRLSPTVNPEKRAKNMIPRLRNPDPRGYLMAQAEARVEAEASGDASVAQLLAEKSMPEPEKKKEPQKVEPPKKEEPQKVEPPGPQSA